MLIICNTDDIKHDASYYLYWIRCAEHNDVGSQGYVGVTMNIKKRLSNHNMALSSEKYRKLQGYSEDFIEAFSKVDLIASVIDCGSIQSILNKEKLLRPSANIGWNTSQGGKTPSQIKHQSSGDRRFSMLNTLIAKLERDGVFIDKNFMTDDGVKLLRMHEPSTPMSSKCRLELKDASIGLVLGNFYYYDVDYTKTKTFEHDGVIWTFADACKHNKVSLNTACKRYMSYGKSIQESVGFVSFIPKSYEIVYLDGVACKYSSKLSKYSKEDLIKIYDFYKQEKRGFREYCKSFGVEDANMQRYFKRYGLATSVDRRTKDFRSDSD